MRKELWQQGFNPALPQKEVMPSKKKRITKRQLVDRYNEKERRNLQTMGLNKAILIGNLGADPEMRFMPNGSPVTSFRVATSRRYKNREGDTIEETEWHYIVTYGKLAENCNQYTSKGAMVYVEGRLQTRKWDDQEGRTHYRTEIIAYTVQFLKRGASDLDSPDADEIPRDGEEVGEIVRGEGKAARSKSSKPAPKSNRKVIKKGGK